MTSIKTMKRIPLNEIPQTTNIKSSSTYDNDMTVEKFLTKQCDAIIEDLQQHCANLIQKLHNEYEEGRASICQLMDQSASKVKSLCVTLKVETGFHAGQKFRLEPTEKADDNVFKIGRSTGRLFKEKGVSLYKDKEISTTHAKIEIKNGQAFIIDVRSTNGTLLNGKEIEANIPIRLTHGDVICMGGSEMHVHISDLDEEENFASV